uniref:Zinc knuckle CX2CX4HX4C domain-containing protein n=1 Tax=Nelumbo nucifera TaxID=4432 RepID=A0A822YYJ9_NELNU|nr:TPA_asm: hypothetical protein HUJ06_006915 [Nelumbo nucifera]
MVRLRLEIDLRRSLFRGLVLITENGLVWIRFTYENLTKLCIHCGVVEHSWKKCKQSIPGTDHEAILKEFEDRKVDAPGDWLRAEHKPDRRPLKYPEFKKNASPCKQLQFVQQQRYSSSDEDPGEEEEDGIQEKRQCTSESSLQLQAIKSHSKEKKATEVSVNSVNGRRGNGTSQANDRIRKKRKKSQTDPSNHIKEDSVSGLGQIIWLLALKPCLEVEGVSKIRKEGRVWRLVWALETRSQPKSESKLKPDCV